MSPGAVSLTYPWQSRNRPASRASQAEVLSRPTGIISASHIGEDGMNPRVCWRKAFNLHHHLVFEGKLTPFICDLAGTAL